MIKMLRYSLKFLLVFVCATIGSFFIAAILAPPVFSFLEEVTNIPLPYEGAIRLYILFAAILILFAGFTWFWEKGSKRHWLIFSILFFSFINLLGVFFFDTKHRLFEEFSWIRYSTAGFLFLTAMSAILISGHYLSGSGKSRTFSYEKVRAVGWIWSLMSLGFIFVGFDELFELHEAIGKFMTTRLAVDQKITDYITLIYAILALIFISGIAAIFKKEYLNKHNLFLKTLVAGGFVYFASTLLDTADTLIGNVLRYLAVELNKDQTYIFSDFWYILWNPHNFLNGLEEVFEQTAAALFFASFLVLFAEKRFVNFIKTLSSTPKRNFYLRFTSATVFAALIFLSLTNFYKNFFIFSPLVWPQAKILQIAGPVHGLKHTDDIFYDNKSKTLFVANEGGSNIYKWDETGWKELADIQATEFSKSVDSVTVGGDGVFSAADGLASDGTALFIINEADKTINKYVKKELSLSWKPDHLLWQAPEGIAYDPISQSLIVTDDETGAIFKVNFGKSAELIAKVSRAEDVAILAGGGMLVTDNAWGAIFLIAPDGAKKKLAQFRRVYRDLQGIAVDQDQNIYVVTSDGYDSQSFMPSFLWKINNIVPK